MKKRKEKKGKREGQKNYRVWRASCHYIVELILLRKIPIYAFKRTGI
jgi:hypothetical protein